MSNVMLSIIVCVCAVGSIRFHYPFPLLLRSALRQT